MANILIQEQRKRILKQYWKYWKCPTGPHSLARSVWNLSPLTQLTIYRIREKCETTSSVVQTSKYGTSLVVNENRFEICEKFEKKKKKSYIHLLDSQLEDRRLQLCEMMHDQISNEPGHLDGIIWSKEVSFKFVKPRE